MKRKTIAIDIDDVLAISADEFIKFSNERWGTNLTIEDYDEDWSKIWKVNLKITNERASVWHDSGRFGLKAPMEKGRAALIELGRSYDLVVATSRRKELEKETLRWLDVHYKGIFSGVHFSGIWEKRVRASNLLTKAELCRNIGADYLIDDQAKHCIGAAEAGITSLLFGDYPWNRRFKNLPNNVTRVKDWDGVLEYFNAQS